MFDGFTMNGDQLNATADTCVIRCWANGTVLRSNIMDGRVGILFKGGTGSTALANRITANATAIVVQPNPASNVAITGNKFIPGTSPVSDAKAIYMTSVTGASITGNSAAGFPWDALAGSNNRGVDLANPLLISCNTFTGCRKGLSFWGNTMFVSIVNNTFTGHSTAGIDIKGQDISIANNTLTGNPKGVIIDKNTLATERVVISRNDLSGNTTAGLEVTVLVTATVNAENNWWGSLIGPTYGANPGGSGSAVVGTIGVAGNVDFSPWLGLPADTSSDCGFQPNLTPVYHLPAALVFTTQPGGANLGDLLSPQPVVRVNDEFGNVAVQYQGPVTLTIGVNPDGGVLAYTAPVNAVNGIATFADVKINTGGGSGYKLLATVAATPALTVLSDPFDIANPAPTIASLSPFWIRAGSADFTLEVTGTAFVPTSKIYWNGVERTTTFVSASKLTTLITTAEIGTPGSLPVKVVTPTPGGGTTAELTFRIEAASPTMVYVDDGFAGLANDTTTDWPCATGPSIPCPGTHIIGYDAFATVQGGVNAVATGGTVKVAAGTYTEYVTVNKSVGLRGPNYGTSPNNGGSRIAEAIILPATTDNSAGSVVTVTASTVSIDGFTIDGDNPVLPASGVGFGGIYGTSIDALNGVLANANGLTDVAVRNNIVQNFSGTGIRLQQATEYFATSSPLLRVLRGEQGGVRDLQRHHSPCRGHLSRRGVPRRRWPPPAVRYPVRDRDDVARPCSARSACRSPSESRTKFLAKVASGVAKPDGLLVVPPDRELDFLHPLAVERLWGVGIKTATKLHDRGIDTVADVARLEQSTLMSILGPHAGRHLHALAHNYDPRPVEVGRRRRSIGSQRVIGWRAKAPGEIEATLAGLVDRVTRRLRAANRVGRTVVLRMRFEDWSRATRSHTMARPTARTEPILETARGLLADVQSLIDDQGLTLIGVAVMNLDDDDAVQLPLPFDRRTASRLDAALDEVRDRFGSAAVSRAAQIGHDPGFAVPMLPD